MFILFLHRVWAWLKKYWKYLLFPVGLILGAIAMFSGRREVGDVVAPGEVETEDERTKASDEAKAKAAAAAESKRKALEDIEREHFETLEKLTKDQRAQVKELREDPDKLNEFLLGVGKEVRGG
jgi:hypothetical protein